MIVITRKSDKYDPAKVIGRYVRYEPCDGTYRWCETMSIGRKGRIMDVAVGTCEDADLPGDVAAAARAACVISPPYVVWPLTGAQ